MFIKVMNVNNAKELLPGKRNTTITYKNVEYNSQFSKKRVQGLANHQ